ncbi:hypothetical protein GOV14_03105 [Candidatus Pacearchaeota archaeon]|nr:hypothetical protein [Candidatus Pacearchaeota archaeon]
MARSVMAEYFFKQDYAALRHVSKSCGVDVKDQGEIVPIQVWQAMMEKGIDIKHHRSVQLREGHLEWPDKAIVLCKPNFCPDYLRNSRKSEFWYIDDPIKGYDSITHARDIIEVKISNIFST